jgi:KaiC/GvpD/RAD55 family RecA-like ATPase
LSPGPRPHRRLPLHPSTSPAVLSIKKEDGQVLLECADGCPDHKIVAAIGIDLSDLTDFDDDKIFSSSVPDNDDEDEDEVAGNNSTALPPVEYAYVPLRFNAFDVKSLDDWITEAEERPDPSPLFGDFWLERELSIMFADTGKGKSILALQIADSLARGVPVAPFELDLPPQKVLYFDFEMSGKQIQKRYRGRETGIDRYRFNPNIIRAQISSGTDYPAVYENFSHFVHDSFEELLRDVRPDVVIVDNITFLNNSSNTSSARAIRLISELQRFKNEYETSMLILAHTPKRRPSHALTVNDLQGSKMLSNFADNIFAIGESSRGNNIRYLKHIKPRGSEMTYDASNVCVFKIEKRDNFLGFNFTGYSTEREHILPFTLGNNANREVLVKKVKELHEEGLTQRQIAALLAISIATVNRYLKK